MAGTARVMVDPGNGVLEGQPLGDVGVQLLTQSPFTTPTDLTPKTAGERFDAKASVKYVPVYDADYQVELGVTHAGVQTLTHAITIYFPDVDTFPMGLDFVVSDESGFCSDTLPINLAPGPGTQDQIEDGQPIALTSRRQSLRFRRTFTTNLWVLS